MLFLAKKEIEKKKKIIYIYNETETQWNRQVI